MEKIIEQMKSDILKSLGQENNPVGILLDAYLSKMVKDIIEDELIRFQCYLADENLITDHDWAFEEKAEEYLKTK
jgi:hypothetical protein